MVPIQGLVTLIGSFFIHLTLGTIFTFGNMSLYISSYIHVYENKTDVTLRDVVWIYAMIFVGQGIFFSIGGLIDNKIGPRLTTFIGCFLATSGIAVSYFTIKLPLAVMALTYGLCCGIRNGIAYTPPLAAGMSWFPKNKGLVNGIILGGFGLAPLIFTQVQTLYINPNNCLPNDEGYFTDSEMLSKIPNVFLLLGGIYSIFQLIGCSLLTRPRMENNVKKECNPVINNSNNSENSLDFDYGSMTKLSGINKENLSPSVENLIENKRSMTPKQVLRCKQFYILWFTFFLTNQVVIFMELTYKVYGQTFIKDDKYLATVGAVSGIFNSGGRIIWGLIMDKLNYKKCMLGLTIGLCLFTATLGLTPYGGRYMFAVWIWSIYLLFSGSFVLFPTCTTQTFGMEHAGINFGLVFTNVIISGLSVAVLAQNFWIHLGWFGFQGLLAGFSALGFIITLLFTDIK